MYRNMALAPFDVKRIASRYVTSSFAKVTIDYENVISGAAKCSATAIKAERRYIALV